MQWTSAFVSATPLLSKSEISSLKPFCGCTVCFVSDQVRNREDRFSLDEAHMILYYLSELNYNIETKNAIVLLVNLSNIPNYNAKSMCLPYIFPSFSGLHVLSNIFFIEFQNKDLSKSIGNRGTVKS